MRVIAIDIKCTHTNPQLATILEFAAVGFDTEEDFVPIKFHARFVPKTGFQSDLKSIIDNVELIQDLNDYVSGEFLTATEAYEDFILDNLFTDFYNWAIINQLAYASGKNTSKPYHVNITGIDFIFEKLPLLLNNDKGWKDFINEKVIDVNTLYLTPADSEIPNFMVCKIRAAHFPEGRKYETALDKAYDIACLAYLKLSQ